MKTDSTNTRSMLFIAVYRGSTNLPTLEQVKSELVDTDEHQYEVELIETTDTTSMFVITEKSEENPFADEQEMEWMIDFETDESIQYDSLTVTFFNKPNEIK